MLHFRDPRTGQVLTTPEDVTGLEREIRRARRRADQAEARIRELEAEVERLRRERPGGV